VAYRDFVQANHEVDGERCSASTVLTLSDEAELRVVCNRASAHLSKHRADIVPLAMDGATLFGLVTDVEWVS
jgi:hypothetical protein